MSKAPSKVPVDPKKSHFRVTPALEPLLVPVDELWPDPANFNVHPEENLAEIERSYRRFGQLKPIVAREDGMIVAGNGQYTVALRLGATHMAAVRAADLSPEELKLYGIADNATQLSSHFDDAALKSFLCAQKDADPFFEVPGFSEAQIAGMLGPPPGDAQGSSDVSEAGVDPITAPKRCQTGDVWRLGAHALIVGDCTKDFPHSRAESLLGKPLAAVVSDPPYGIDALGSDGKIGKAKAFGAIEGDLEPFSPDWMLDLNLPLVALFGANHFAAHLPHSSRWLVWDKRGGNADQNDFADCELCWVHRPDRPAHKQGVARVFRHVWNGANKASEKGEDRQHPTQKPVAVLAWVIETETQHGDLVCDPYVGSGTTLIACEQLGRACLAWEINCRFSDVVLARWELLTGQKAVKL